MNYLYRILLVLYWPVLLIFMFPLSPVFLIPAVALGVPFAIIRFIIRGYWDDDDLIFWTGPILNTMDWLTDKTKKEV
jgi:hypothetical protein